MLFILAKLSSCVNKHNCNDDAPAEADGEPLAQDGVAVLLLVQANGDQVPCQSLHTASQSVRQTIHNSVNSQLLCVLLKNLAGSMVYRTAS